MGLFRTVRTLVREYLNFGQEEVHQLKQHLEKQRAQLQQLKVVREQRQQHEEKIALLELRRVVQQMQNAELGRGAQEEAVVEAVGQLGDKMQRIMTNDLEVRAAGVLQSIDFQEVLTGVPASATSNDTIIHKIENTDGSATSDKSSRGSPSTPLQAAPPPAAAAAALTKVGTTATKPKRTRSSSKKAAAGAGAVTKKR